VKSRTEIVLAEVIKIVRFGLEEEIVGAVKGQETVSSSERQLEMTSFEIVTPILFRIPVEELTFDRRG
jgi:hypothetical protein